MVNHGIFEKMDNSLRALPRHNVYFALGIALFILALNALGMTYNTGYSKGWNACTSITNGGFLSGGPDPIQLRNIKIEIAIFVSIVGIWSRRFIGYLISMLSLTWVGWQYLDWWLYSLRWLEQAGLKDFSELRDPNFTYAGKFIGASWWNPIVLIMSLTLLTWQLKTLATILYSLRNTRHY